MAGSKQQSGTVAGDLAALLESGNDSDVTLVAGDAQMEAHRLILAARSRVFAEMLRRHRDDACLEIRDVEGGVLRQLLVFIYTDEAPELAALAPQLLVSADQYDLKVLKDKCEQQLMHDICSENAAARAVLAVERGCPALRRAAVDFIRSHPDSVRASQGWADALIHHPKALAQVSRLVEGPARVENRAPPQRAASSQETYRAPRGPEDLASRGPLGVLKSKSHPDSAAPPDVNQTPDNSSSRKKSESSTADPSDVTDWFALRMAKATGPKSGPLSRTLSQELQVSGKSPLTEVRPDTGNKSELEAETCQKSISDHPWWYVQPQGQTHNTQSNSYVQSSQLPQVSLRESNESLSSTKSTSTEDLITKDEVPWWLPVPEDTNL